MVVNGVSGKAVIRLSALQAEKAPDQCDLQKDGCGQCRRAKLTCEGYRDPGQLVFRDETESARCKVLAREAQREHVSAISRFQLAWDVRARQAFFSHYVFGLSRSYDMLAPLYQRDQLGGPGGCLSASVDAVSLAFLSHQYDGPSLRILANEKYVSAIRLLADALVAPEKAATDETLQAVLLLDLYEKLVNRTPVSSSAWMSHINGALTLAKIRGQKNLSSYISRRLGTRLAITLIISCAAADIRVPESLNDLRRELGDYLNEDPKWLITGLVVELVNLNADIHDGRVTDGDEILARAEDLESRFILLECALPSSWHPTRVGVQRHEPLAFENFYDIYTDHFVTQVRNVSRTTRISLNLMIKQHVISASLATRAADTIAEICRDLCASVPQFILPDARPENKRPFTALQTLQCYTLVKPLYVAGKFSTDVRMRSWVVDVLNHIADAGGVREAKEVADVLRTAPETSHWNVYAMLGSYAFAA